MFSKKTYYDSKNIFVNSLPEESASQAYPYESIESQKWST